MRPLAHQHPIRGNFGDPRIKQRNIDVGIDNALSFHSGVDVQAPDGTPVYAIAAGAALVRPFVVDVLSPYLAATPPLLFAYWHIDPVVDSFQRVERGQLLGFVRAGFGHVHLSEERFGEFVNPLRPGGLSPYTDRTFPVLGRLIAFRSGTAEVLDTDALSGIVDLAIEVTDPPPIRPTDGWGDVVLSPERISWSGLFGEWLPAAFRPAGVDFDRLPRRALTDIYAPGTRENVAGRPGDYRFWLARNLDTALLSSGPHGLRVHPGVMPGWDNTPRRRDASYVFHGANPLSFRRWLARASAAALAGGGTALLFVNAWNEWAEGAHLEPDARFGRAYLEAVRDALGVDERAPISTAPVAAESVAR